MQQALGCKPQKMLIPDTTEDRILRAAPNLKAELVAGLTARQAYISAKFFYDALGSKLFEAICELPEYYLTKTEAGIIDRYGAEITRVCGTGTTLIDLGAGNCAKAASLFPLLRPKQYVAVDISGEFVWDAVEQLRRRFADIDMQTIVLDFSNHMDLPQTVNPDQRLFFYPGSSIGNFAPAEVFAFLARLRAECGDDGGLLLGIDLIKDHATLHAAYDDALGVTAAFNLNVLHHANALADTDFDVHAWRHRAFFNVEQCRIEMHLEARHDVTVRWPSGARYFKRGQSIHTENSYKYTRALAATLLERTGWCQTAVWTDSREWFALIHARPDDTPEAS